MFKLRHFTTSRKISVILNSVAATCLKKVGMKAAMKAIKKKPYVGRSQKHCCGERVSMQRGKLFGGQTNLNLNFFLTNMDATSSRLRLEG